MYQAALFLYSTQTKRALARHADGRAAYVRDPAVDGLEPVGLAGETTCEGRLAVDEESLTENKLVVGST